jgi:hypothetical protein
MPNTKSGRSKQQDRQAKPEPKRSVPDPEAARDQPDQQGPGSMQAGPTNKTGEAIVQALRSMSRSAFVTRSPRFFMVIVDRSTDDSMAFQTIDVSAGFGALSETLRANPVQNSKYDLLAIEKAPGNPYLDRISVGRARNCDLVLRSASVSKLHAHFRVRRNGRLEIIDLDSQNGTFVNGVRVASNMSEAVQSGDEISFGTVVVWVLDAGALYDLMQ